jgi:DNA-binding NarL/FixJ family response regulator
MATARSAPEPLAENRPALLTPREEQVLRCLADGLGTKVIAESLTIAPVTVRNHVQNILRKLDAHSKLEAVLLAMRENLIPPRETGARP